MSISLLTKSFLATAVAIAPYLIVKATAAAETVQIAGAATDPLVGSSGQLGCDAGGLLDIVQAGEDEVTAGGNIAFGDPLTSDANGKAVKATATAGSTVSIIGYANQKAVAGDVFRYRVAPGLLYAPAA
jgi:hypothetical protein